MVVTASALGSAGGVLTEAERGIKTMRGARGARHRRLTRDRYHFAKTWRFEFDINNDDQNEKFTYQGHEREAMEGFAKYANDSREEASLNLYTNELKHLPPMARFNALVKMMDRRWRVRDESRGYDKMQMALEAAECFADMHAETGKLLSGLDEDYQIMFDGCINATMLFAQRVVAQRPNAVAAMLRAASVCDLLGNATLRDSCLATARESSSTLEDGYAFAQPEKPLMLKEFRPPAPQHVHPWQVDYEDHWKETSKAGSAQARARIAQAAYTDALRLPKEPGNA